MVILLFFSLLAGIVTVISPCIIPVLPIVLSMGVGKGDLRPLGVIVGLILSFTFFTLALNFIIQHTGLSANILRYIAIGVITFFGLLMIFPSLGDVFTEQIESFGQFGTHIEEHAKHHTGFVSGFIGGIALGFIWTPCAGPILAYLISLTALNAANVKVALLLLFYSIGAGIPLFLLAYGGNKMMETSKFFSRHAEAIRRLFGIIMILTAVTLIFNIDIRLQEYSYQYFPALPIENNSYVKTELEKLRQEALQITESGFLSGEQSLLLSKAPEFQGITGWLNSPPLKMSELRGKVVLVDFWTYSCINCIRTFPYLNRWYNEYKDQGFLVIGVHTPEFAFEKEKSNVEKAIHRFDIHFPVAMDNDFMTWHAYGNKYWPTDYLIDQNGIIRMIHYGEGNYTETENKIRELLRKEPKNERFSLNNPRPVTHEIYLGSSRAKNYIQENLIKENLRTAFEYDFKGPLGDDQVGLRGLWIVEPEKITSASNDSKLEINFIASQIYIVLSTITENSAIKVLLDDKPLPREFYTDDFNDKGEIVVKDARNYQVANFHGAYFRRKITLIFEKDINAYAFTFGDE